MSGSYIRIGLEEDRDGSRTDWARLRALGDEEIDRAIAADPDAYAIEETDLIGRAKGSYSYQLYRDAAGSWRWALRSAEGRILAVSGRSFGSREDAELATSELREAILGARSAAA